MKIVEVAQVLAVISKIYEEAGNRGTADGILTFAELLRDYKDATVANFVGQVKKSYLGGILIQQTRMLSSATQ
jgi:hypothetical protein